MDRKVVSFCALAALASTAPLPTLAGNAYQCPNTLPVDSLHNRSGWYVGHYTPETGSYAGTVGSVQTLDIQASSLIDHTATAHTWLHNGSGDSVAILPSGTVNLSLPLGATANHTLTGLNTVAPAWSNTSAQTQWPPSPSTGAMHALIIQRNHLRSSAGSARRSHAIAFARDYFEYRFQNSTDTTVDGVSRGQLRSGSAVLDVEVVTTYSAPNGWGNDDYCWRLFNNNNGYKGFEVQMRPVVYVLGRNHSLAANMPDISGEYSGTLELSYDNLPSSRPVY